MIKVLLVEDDQQLSASLADYLTELEYDVDFAFNGKSALTLLDEDTYDVVIMDVSMPVLDGLDTAKAIRHDQHLDVPIIFLTARDTLEDKLAGFKSGADDYLVKPFSSEELVCRIEAILQRGKLANNSIQSLGELTFNHQLHQVQREGTFIELDDIQFQILSLLAKHAPSPISRVGLEDHLWPDGLPESDPLRTHIYRLRQKLDKPFKTNLVVTVHGKGYRLAIPQ